MAALKAFLSQLWADLTASKLTPIPITFHELEAEWCRVYDANAAARREGRLTTEDMTLEDRLYRALTLADVARMDRRRPA